MASDLRLAFFGTPDFALPSLQALCGADWAPEWVVSQPDRPAGRGRTLVRPPVAEWAAGRGLTVEQPPRVRDAEFLSRFRELSPDLAVVVAFGQIFPADLLEIPRLGCLNVHASLLPRHRGAAPIQAAIRAGDVETGVSTMRMDAGLDTGPVYRVARTPLHGRETAGELSARLAYLGAGLLLETVAALAAGSATANPQPETGATYAPRLTRADGAVDWQLPAPEVFAHLRSVTPWPGLTATLGGRPLKLVWGEPRAAASAGVVPGTYLGISDGGLRVACGAGELAVSEVQRPGRRVVKAPDFLNGERLTIGQRFE